MLCVCLCLHICNFHQKQSVVNIAGDMIFSGRDTDDIKWKTFIMWEKNVEREKKKKKILYENLKNDKTWQAQ